MANKLTDKQRRFCEEYVIDWNGTRAAIAAGYSENAASETAYENLRKPHIKEYIEEVQNDLSKLTGVTAARNILELKKIAYGNIVDVLKDWGEPKAFNDLTEEEKSIISHIDCSVNSKGEPEVKIKSHDKQRAIEILNKMFGWNAPSEVDITSEGKSIAPIQWVQDNATSTDT